MKNWCATRQGFDALYPCSPGWRAIENTRKSQAWSLILSVVLGLITFSSFGQPVITSQPAGDSVSLGAQVTFQVTVSGTPPFSYQWYLGGTEIAGRTARGLTITNIQVTNAGDYTVVVANAVGSVTSQVARLEVDPTFTKIMAGSIVTEVGTGAACAWGDYDNDGFIDLFVTSAFNPLTGTPQTNLLFHNNRDASFTKITKSVVSSELRDWRCCSWADYDNDGYLDLMATSAAGNGFPAQNELFRNNGDGTFTRMTAQTAGAVVSSAGDSEAAVWADYDRDGFVDLFIARYGPDWLFHNNGDGTFAKVLNGTSGMPLDNQDSYGAMWGDYDNDGWPDLLVTVKSDAGQPQENFLYHNNGQGAFTRLAAGPVATDNEHSISCAWIDYDNDGRLDLFVVNGLSVFATNSLYHNNGDGSFTKMTSQQVGSLVSDEGIFVVCAWGDYDNDGWLDVFITKLDNGSKPSKNCLYHNNGDGRFTRILSGSLVNDLTIGSAGAWGDYDNDGFLDLFVACGGDVNPAPNLLYRNNGNSNAWLKVNLVGTVSNRSAVGAKVRLRATIRGRTFWQMREVNTGAGFTAGPLEAHFGLGDASRVDILRIEWPSGTVQEFQNLGVKQRLTFVEPPRLRAVVTNNVLALSLKGGRGLHYQIERSPDLVSWSALATVTPTNMNGTAIILDTNPTNSMAGFYRARTQW